MKNLTRFTTLLLTLLALSLAPQPLLAQEEPICQDEVVVQAGDWLSKIAEKAYGDLLAYPLIVEATNAKAQVDDSFATITNPDLIEPGWKLCLPAVEGTPQTAEAAPATPVAPAEAPSGDTVAHLTLLHLNDIYELTPVSGGQAGGLARVATIYKDLKAQNPNTFFLLAGDLFSPSALGTARVDGERLAGRQMVSLMNEIGLDFITFGNHEFDIDRDQFLSRLEESNFIWFSGNVFDQDGHPFPGVAANHIFTVDAPNGNTVRVGLLGVTIPSNAADYVTYSDPLATAAEQVAALSDQVDILLGLTHLPVDDDLTIARSHPEIDLILGGHEHENMRRESGPGTALVYKADANARTVYIHDLYYDTATGDLTIESRLQPVTPDTADDPAAAALVEEWLDKGFAGFVADGFEPRQVITEVPLSLDGLESSVRNQPTELTDLIAASMLAAAPDTELAIFNSGSVRIDDVIPPGPISQYDVIRILPFGGTIVAVEMSGSLLQQVLDQGQANQGGGGYLQTANVSRNSDDSGWLIGGEPLDESRTYRVAINDFLISGREQNLDYLNQDNPELTVIAEYEDVRKALIAALKARFSE